MIAQPQPDGPVEPAKYAYTYGVQVLARFFHPYHPYYMNVKGRCNKQQLWPARVTGRLQVGFLQEMLFLPSKLVLALYQLSCLPYRFENNLGNF